MNRWGYIRILFQYTAGKRLLLIFGVILAGIAQVMTLATPFLTQYLIDEIIGKSNYHLLNIFILIAFSILIIFSLTSLASVYILTNIFRKSGIKLRTNLFKKIQHAPLDFFEKTSGGEISYRLLQDASVIENSWNTILVILPLQCILFSAGVIMAIWNFKLAIFVFFILGSQAIVIAKFRKPLLRYAKLTLAKDQDVTGYVVEHFQKIQLVRSLSTEKKEQRRFQEKLQDLVKISIRTNIMNKLSMIIVSLVNNLWAFGVLFYGGLQVMSGELTLGTLMAFLLLSSILYQPVATLTNLILSYQNIKASLQRFLEYSNIKSPIHDSPQASPFIPKEGKITFKDVSFSYNTRSIIDKLNLEIPAKTTFALVGKSGVGKTTLCRLLIRFYDSQQGSILLDDRDIKNITLSSLRKSVLFMLQNDYVISGTIWENLTYGIEAYTEEQVYKAAQEASLDFIEKLPDGYNTRIGQGGINLSVGETQRIAIARAFLISPKVLILDEPTSFLDAETEEKLKQSILTLKKQSTIILIAHRLSTVLMADKIGVLEDGKIIETGTHNELIEKEDGAYRKIYRSILSK